MKIYKIAKKEANYDSSWTAIVLPKEIAKKIIDFSKKIPDRELFFDDDNSKGREDEPHITIQYGIKNNPIEKLKSILKGEKGGKIKIGKISIFENEKFDVLKIEVISPKLHKIKKIILENVKAENKFPKYLPHITIAYLHPGAAKKYKNEYEDFFNGIEFSFSEITYRKKNSQEYNKIKLENENI